MEKIQNSYETVLVISLKLGDEGVAAMVQKFKDLIEALSLIHIFLCGPIDPYPHGNRGVLPGGAQPASEP